MRLMTILFACVLLVSCETTTEANKDKLTSLNGKELMENQCYSCHNTQGTDNMLAPPMFRVKDHYWDDETSKDEFIDDIVNWVMDPKEENSVMPGARRKFGLMPKQNFKKEEITAIAEYMYDNNLEQESCSH